MVSFCFLCEFLEINYNWLKRSLNIDNTLTGLDNLRFEFGLCKVRVRASACKKL